MLCLELAPDVQLEHFVINLVELSEHFIEAKFHLVLGVSSLVVGCCSNLNQG